MDLGDVNAPRRTWLAAERTFLAWWRTGLAAAVAALAVGRLLPEVVDGRAWPFVALGLGYGAVAIAVFTVGARRQRELAEDIARGGEFRPLSRALTLGLSLAGIALTVATMALIATAL
ncbi:MAG TPA: DUF202 domain-containing protein [Capillimicrobium sp.]